MTNYMERKKSLRNKYFKTNKPILFAYNREIISNKKVLDFDIWLIQNPSIVRTLLKVDNSYWKNCGVKCLSSVLKEEIKRGDEKRFHVSLSFIPFRSNQLKI